MHENAPGSLPAGRADADDATPVCIFRSRSGDRSIRRHLYILSSRPRGSAPVPETSQRVSGRVLEDALVSVTQEAVS